MANLYSFRSAWTVGCLFVTTVAWGVSAADGQPSYPNDPYAFERERQPATDIGAARGQTRLSVLAALVDGNNSAAPYVGGELGCEFMLHEFGGVRFAVFQDHWETDGHALARKFSSFWVGPALHLRPYRRVDLGAYAEGGLVVVDLIDGRTSDKAPEAAAGVFVSVHLDSFVFMQFELERAWANIEINNAYGNQDRTAAMLGIGVAF